MQQKMLNKNSWYKFRACFPGQKPEQYIAELAKNGIPIAVIKGDEYSNFHRLDAIYTKQARAKELDNNSNFKLRCYAG